MLKFAKERHGWLQWFSEAKKRYGLVILNYTITNFVRNIKSLMGGSAIGRKDRKAGESYQLRETQIPYNDYFEAQKGDIGIENACFGDINL
ncbi:hypothetical protein HXW94_12490 [Desulfobacter latus]|uniref:Uncharacterized protein n=1 Tax=Desulfobacter latus TaxID=2292 RepID=A0A850T258_9BACT|nr:hypothetical protein [Desulfobacter latus]